MNRAGGAPGGGGLQPGVGTSQAKTLQKQRALQQRVDADVSSLVDNFTNMIRAAKVNDPVRNSQEGFQISVHAAKIVAAAESLLQLVAELKRSAVFADFAALNASVAASNAEYMEQSRAARAELAAVERQIADAVRELEE